MSNTLRRLPCLCICVDDLLVELFPLAEPIYRLHVEIDNRDRTLPTLGHLYNQRTVLERGREQVSQAVVPQIGDVGMVMVHLYMLGEIDVKEA